jgi:8-oxo-dGTP pyrophosphatase MutT (NUDIX family)
MSQATPKPIVCFASVYSNDTLGYFYLGLVDSGESDLESALRETEEESGLTETDLRIVADFKKTIKVSIFVVFIWKCGRAVHWKYCNWNVYVCLWISVCRKGLI